MAFKAELLRKKLKEEGKTRKFLAQATRKTERTVSRWLNGQNPPKGKDLDLIAMALKCRPQDFDPSYADEGLGVAMYARVSVASHNAYEMMRLRYGVTQKSIIELAPVLFSIVAGHALKVPEEDMALYREASRRGLSSPLPADRSYEGAQGFALDQRASENGACFGLPAADPVDAQPRNLFREAMSRLCLGIAEHVSTELFDNAEPGDAPSAIGFVPDIELLNTLTGGDADLIKAIVEGRLRLSQYWEEHQKSDDPSMASFPGILRRELARAIDERSTQLKRKREESLARLEAWRAYYGERHPDLAREYDEIVAAYCHADGWFPEYFGDELQELLWSDPYREERFIDKKLLPGRSGTSELSFTPSAIEKRFSELEAHRSKVKAKFEELGE